MGVEVPPAVAEPMKRVESLSEMVLEFLENSAGFDGGAASDDEDSDGEDHPGSAAERAAFWEEQHQLLQEALSRNSATEARIKVATEDLLRKLQSLGNACTCLNPNGGGSEESCRNCVRAYIAGGLRDVGYNSAICKCKWRRSPDIPSGEHSCIDVVVEAKKGKKGPFRVVIELNFRAEFVVARASQEYNSLVSRLPEVFVGKSEKLRGVLKIMCGAAKKCMKENKMHMGPWRKHNYMQAKWLGSFQRQQSPVSSVLPPERSSDHRPSKFRASMLTFDLHRTAVKVV